MRFSRLPPAVSRLFRAPRGGFALLIVLTLLAFLVVLLVGLASYARVETAVAGNTQRQAQARENALLALNIALGQLQKYAGPDRRVTAAADAFANRAGTAHYTGVWPSDPADFPDVTDPAAPLTWLVSGNELVAADGTAQPLAVTPAAAVNTTNGVALVSTNTSRTANDVLARLMPITATGVPGAAIGAPATIGRYAWWVGDQGVKAPVAMSDNSASVTFAPYGDGSLQGDLGRRLRQQIAVGAGAADTAGAPVFEPRDANNASLVASQKISSPNQFAFLRNSANAQLGVTRAQQNFHAWSPNNFAVLANTKLGGLRQDLSLKPELLGAGFAKWANYDPANGGYMESLVAPAAPTPIPALGSDPIRRRYAMRPPTTADGAVHSVVPVLSHFLLGFNVRTVNGSTAASAPLQVRAHWAVSLWNPYTSALVPEEKLRLEIENLPAIQIDDEESVRGSAVVRGLSLHSLFGSPMAISLPWSSVTINSGTATPDNASWLPGRVYSWVSAEDTSGNKPDATIGYASVFNSRDINGDSGQGVIVDIPNSPLVDGDHLNDVHDFAAPRALTLTLYAVRPDGDVKLATFTSPDFTRFTTTFQKFSQGTYQFAYVFRLKEGTEDPAWLSSDGRDFRSGTLDASAFAYEASQANPENPASFAGYVTVSSPDRLLDRRAGDLSYNEDTPLFELPRAPLLSLGSLQHVALAGRRPFAIGNSWAGDAQLNGVPVTTLFDRFFFSGLVPGVQPSPVNGALLLPNPQQKVLRDPATGDAVTLADLQGAGDAQPSKFLLQGAAFNLNSVNPAAWAAVLRSVRFPAPQSFVYLDADPATGTAADDSTQAVQSTDAFFFRFPQSAQETYKADPLVAGGSEPSAANTHLFRRGARSLTAEQVAQLAARITDAVKARLAAAGPFRSLEEFLAAGDAGAPSLLEQAIADAGINADIAEFSSQWLTQADVMTALAPVLFPRSDTFLIRAYGEAVNPATNATEGRAWCEALVQRVPDYLDRTQPAETAPAELNEINQANGRRFKVVSFRWLTRSDI